MTEGKTQVKVWLRDAVARWLRVTAAERGIPRSQLVEELIEAEQQKNGR